MTAAATLATIARMLPDLDSLALFARAAEAGSLTKAAEASHIATPAASRRLALLERHFGARLFERHSRGLDLTPAGACLLGHVRTLLDEVHRTQAELAHYASGQASVLRVCANTSSMVQFLPADIAGFQQQHPDVRLVLEEHWSEAGAQAVRTNQAHVCVVVEGPWTEGLRCLPYRSDRLAVILPPKHPLQRSSLHLRDVLACDFVSLEGRSSLMGLLAEKAAELDMPLKIRAQVKSFEAVCRMVQAGMGIGLLPQSAAQALGAAMGLQVVALEDEWAHRRMLLCVRDTEPEPALRLLLDYLSAVAAAAPA